MTESASDAAVAVSTPANAPVAAGPADSPEASTSESATDSPDKEESISETSVVGTACFALVAATVLVFWQVARFEFVGIDDYANILDNPRLRPISLENVIEMWKAPYLHLYVPLTYTFFAGEGLIARNPTASALDVHFNPMIFHLGSLALHLCCSLLTFSILRSIVGSLGPALIGALVFAIHPLQAETVSWVTETKGLLATAFSLLFIRIYVSATRPAEEGGGITSLRVLAMVAALLLGLLSKPTAAAAPLVALAIGLGFRRGAAMASIKLLAPMMGIVVAFTIVTKILQPDSQITGVPPLWARGWIALDALSFYFTKIFAPIQLAPDYGRSPQWVMRSGWNYFIWLLPIQALLVLWFIDESKRFFTAALIFVAGVAPVLGFIPFGFQNQSTVADRYAYLAMLGVALAVAMILDRWWRPESIAAAAVTLVALGWMAHAQASHWRNNETLFAHALSVNPRSNLAAANLGVVLFHAGKHGEAIEHFEVVLKRDPYATYALGNLADVQMAMGKVDDAIKNYRRAIELEPSTARFHNGLANALLNKGKPEDALVEADKAIELEPERALFHATRGLVLSSLKRSNDAITSYATSVSLDPMFCEAREKLGGELIKSGRYREALDELEAVRRIDPARPFPFFGAGVAMGELRLYNEAIAAYREALRLKPDWHEPAENLSVLLAMHPDPNVRDPKTALDLAEKVCAATKRRRVEPLEALATALLFSGRFADSLAAQEEALALARSQGSPDAIFRVQSRLEKMRQMKSASLALPR